MKNWIKKISIGLLIVGVTGEVYAQEGYYNEALLFSRNQFGGSARIQALGGAQVALGGDISLSASNPAGLGFFNRNTFTFSPGVDMHSTQSDYFGSSTSNYKNKFVLPQVGLVFNNSKGNVLPDDFKGGSFAVSIQRTNDFNSYMQYLGRNSQNSIVNSFIAKSQGRDPEGLDRLEELAYFEHFLFEVGDFSSGEPFAFSYANGNTYLEPTFNSTIGYSSVIGSDYSYNPLQAGDITTEGGQYVLNASWGGNYRDIFYFGAGLGFNFLNYDRSRSFSETNYQLEDGTDDGVFKGITIADRVSVEGSGIDASVGAIFRALPFLTIGASYHSPTFYALNENSDYSFTSEWGTNVYYVADIDGDANIDTTNLGSWTTESDIIVSDYTLRTPSRLNVGAALFAGKRGFLSGEVEMMDFSTAQLQSSDFQVFEDNNAIINVYQRVFNYKLGAEIRFDELRLRGGYNYQADPYRDSGGINRSITSYSGGIGYRNKDYFVDFVAIYRDYDQSYNPYSYYLPTDYDGPSPQVKTNVSSISSMVTIGMTF